MHNRYVTTLGLLLVLACLPACASLAASWTSFIPAAFSGIQLTPAPATGQLTYTLSLGPTPKITIGSNTFDVNWVQAFYLISQEPKQGFTCAAGSAVTDWQWESKTNPGYIAGWHGQGSNRIEVGESKNFEFASLNLQGNSVVPGLHVGYQSGCREITGYYKGNLSTVPNVPEPTGAGALIAGLCGLPLAARRLRRA